MGNVEGGGVFKHAGEDVFSNDNLTCEFSRGTDGAIDGLESQAYLLKLKWKRTAKPGG